MNERDMTDEQFNTRVLKPVLAEAQRRGFILLAPPPGQKIPHGRHCTCSSCAREDWTNPSTQTPEGHRRRRKPD